MSLLSSVTSILGKKSSGESVAQVYIVPLASDGTIDGDIGKWAFQYWPESIQISNGIEYAQKNVIGGSHPLYQFLCKAERVLSFSVDFSRDLQGDIAPGGTGFISFTPPGSVSRDKYNVDVAQALIWLESLCAVKYGTSDPAGFSPPPTLLVVMPNSRLGRAKGGGTPTDNFQSVMVTCNFAIDAWFPDGTPRHARADLAFAEVVQTSDGIIFADRTNMANAKAGGQAYGVGVTTK